MRGLAYYSELRDLERMLSCSYRHPIVRGLNEVQCRLRRLCYLCAAPVPQGRRHWCSDRCLNLWWDNHGWAAARLAAMRRDRGCVRDPSHRGPFECNHKVPRRGKGYHVGCHNHLQGLEMLCHSCHVAETTRQGREHRAATIRRCTSIATPTKRSRPSPAASASGSFRHLLLSGSPRA